MEDGTAMVPVEASWVAEALGDDDAARRCREAMRTVVLFGERRCG